MTATIAHATDRDGDDAAFVHACALAAASGARLVTIHANAPAELAARLPDAAPLAARWGRPIDHRRVCHECCDEVTDTLLDVLRGLAPQLVVCGTHARRGFATLVRDSVATAIARNIEVPTLVVPNEATGFVARDTGAITLREVIVPAGSRAEALRGIAAARAFGELAGASDVAIEVVHVGDATGMTGLDVPVVYASRPIERAIILAACDRRAAAIVMTTHGHDAARDVLLGSRTEHVIRDAGLPVLSVFGG